jgi:hypothetical protein
VATTAADDDEGMAVGGNDGNAEFFYVRIQSGRVGRILYNSQYYLFSIFQKCIVVQAERARNEQRRVGFTFWGLLPSIRQCYIVLHSGWSELSRFINTIASTMWL